MDAATGLRVTNVLRASITTESGDLLFQPPTVPGEYFLYFLPYRTAGEWYFPTTLYTPPTNSASAEWTSQCTPLIRDLHAGKAPSVSKAHVLEIQSINDFHRFDPMEITATRTEIDRLLASYKAEPYLLFPEDRRNPIRMNDALPARWVQIGPGHIIRGEACQGEFFTFQVGVYASRQPVDDVKITLEDLVSSTGARLPQTALRCFNLNGTNWLGARLEKRLNIPQGHVQAFWCGIAVPESLPAQTYQGKMILSSTNAPATALQIQLTVRDQKLTDSGDNELSRQSRLRWLDRSRRRSIRSLQRCPGERPPGLDSWPQRAIQ
jgi:hypothetical protein